MHLVIPFAAPLSEAGREALRSLSWPQLSRQLAGLPVPECDAADEWTLSPPHERAVAAALGWTGADGLWPFAARQALADGVAAAGPLGLVTPVHWHLGTEQISMGDPEALPLADVESRRLLELVAPLFTSEGFALHYGAPTRWYLEHPSLAALPTASLDRVIGRNVDPWLGDAPGMRLVRRLQNEVQMLLHEHPINQQREQKGLLAVNSFWLSGTGVSQAAAGEAPTLDARLRRAALADDWAAWARTWALLDEAIGQMPWQRLTLCGERSSLTWSIERRSRWQLPWRRFDLGAALETL